MPPGRRRARRRGMIVGAAVGKSMAKKSAPKSAPAEQSQSDSGNASDDMAKQLTDLKGLLDNGVLTQEEFDAKKKQILGL